MTLARRLATPRAGLLGLAALSTAVFLALLATAGACGRCGVESVALSPPALDRVPAPVLDRPTPARHDAAPASRSSTPAGQEAAPASTSDTPAGQDAAPAPMSTASAGHDAAPAPSTHTPAGQEAAPASTSNTPAGQEAAPASTSTAPAGQDAAPARATGDPPPRGDVNPDLTAAARYVRAFYADLVAGRFAAAWPRLAADVRARHGGLEAWRRGFAATVHQSTSAITARAAGPGAAVVTLTLTAVDRAPCGRQVTRRFAVEWRLRRSRASWSAVHATARPLGAAPASCGRGVS